MKSFTAFLLVPFALLALTATTFASAPPTLDDTMADDMAVAQTEGTASMPQSEEPEEPVVTAEEEAPFVSPTATTAEATPILVSVSEVVIARAIVDREPVDTGTLFTTDTERLYCHSRIASIAPATITHVWYRDGEAVAEIPLQIGAGSSWRTWSSKTIFPPTPAAWRVEILAEDGTLLATTDFTVE